MPIREICSLEKELLFMKPYMLIIVSFKPSFNKPCFFWKRIMKPLFYKNILEFKTFFKRDFDMQILASVLIFN